MKRRIFVRCLAAPLAVALCSATLGFIAENAADGQMVHATGPLPSFEVATIKPAKQSGSGAALTMPPPNVFRELGITTRTLICVAYGLPAGSAEGPIVGGPSWLDNDRYDIEGKVPDALMGEMQKLAPDQRRAQRLLMVQGLLADRFKLVAHIEMRELRIYELVVSKGGAKLKPAQEPPVDLTSGNPSGSNVVGPSISVRRKTPKAMELTAKAETLDDLVQVPFLGLGSPAVNKTGLPGKYDFVLDWMPDVQGDRTTSSGIGNVDAPSLFTAFEEQLGLKLVSAKGPVEIIVIDRVEKPSEN